MISFEQAIDLVRRHASLLPEIVVPADAALTQVLACDVMAPESLPGFDNAAMDGFAVSAAHLALPVGTAIPLSGLQAAGDPQTRLAEAGCRIMTGAVVPIGTATVVPVEAAVVHADAKGRMSLTLNDAFLAGMHIRRAGEDIHAGALALAAGTRLQASHQMLLAALGVHQVRIRAPVMAAVLCTGAELVSDTGRLADGQIRNSNGPYLHAALPTMGAQLGLSQVLPDSASAYIEAVCAAERAGCRIIISTGAVSMGVHDFVPTALQALGAEIVFHKLSMRPGKPTLFAVLPSGALLFGLPGNPMSCAVGARFFVQEAIRVMQGRAAEVPLPAVLQNNLEKKAGWTRIQKAVLTVSAAAQLQVRVLSGQESFRIHPFAQANAWAVLPESVTDIAAGTVLACYPLQPSAFLEQSCVFASE